MKRIAFSLLGISVICLSVSTFVEKYHGTPFVSEYIYGSWWFVSLWGMLSLCSFIYMLKRKLQRRFPSFLLHSSFLVILLGALLTALTAERGMLHLRKGEKENMFVSGAKEGGYIRMPMTIELDTFVIHYYPGTQAPADYESRFTVTDEAGNSVLGQVAMNRIFTYKSFRFYQSSFDEDREGSWLSVNIDRWGIPVTYSGYFLLFISMVWLLLSPQGRFRGLLKSPLLRTGLPLIACLCMGNAAKAESRMLSKEDAGMLGGIQILYNDRITPLQTLAYEFTLKLTGKTSYKEYTAGQVLSGWLFFPETWRDQPMIRIKNKQLRRLLGVGEYASYADFFTGNGTYRLQALERESFRSKQTILQKAIAETDEKVQLINMLRNTALLQVFPITGGERTVWYSPVSSLPDSLDPQTKLFIKDAFPLLAEAALKGDNEQLRSGISRLKTYQSKNGGRSVLAAGKLEAERIYNRIPFTDWLYRLNLVAGLVTLLVACRAMLHKEAATVRKKRFMRLFPFLLFFSFTVVTIFLGLRAYISGRLPVGTGYETMILMAWCILLTTLFFYRKSQLITSFGLLLSGFCLLVASLGRMNPQITPLMPVLSSPLLSLHVSLIMMSYALFAFTFLNGLTAILLRIFLQKTAQRAREQAEVLYIISQLFLYPALFLLGTGIFIGAIWANVSWGRYWAWDPKEVWALITFLVYAVALHTESLSFFRRPLWFHGYLCFAFLTVLMTYFGVNYFLGGMHSYGG